VKHEAITQTIIGSAISVHRALGPGLLESSYERCLCHELAKRGVPFKRQVPIPIEYDGVKLACAYRVDLIVADLVVVELKAIDTLRPIHKAQLLTYVRHARKNVGLLFNFSERTLKEGIVRVVL
jgi:GxxExxY protein